MYAAIECFMTAHQIRAPARARQVAARRESLSIMNARRALNHCHRCASRVVDHLLVRSAPDLPSVCAWTTQQITPHPISVCAAAPSPNCCNRSLFVRRASSERWSPELTVAAKESFVHSVIFVIKRLILLFALVPDIVGICDRRAFRGTR